MTRTPEELLRLREAITPGPWRAKSDPVHFDTVSDASGQRIRLWPRGRDVDGFSDWKEQEANTRAIAAVPEMLDTIEAQAAEIEELRQMAREAALWMQHREKMMPGTDRTCDCILEYLGEDK